MTCWCSSIVAAALFPGLGCEFKYSLIVLVVTHLFPFYLYLLKISVLTSVSPLYCWHIYIVIWKLNWIWLNRVLLLRSADRFPFFWVWYYDMICLCTKICWIIFECIPIEFLILRPSHHHRRNIRNKWNRPLPVMISPEDEAFCNRLSGLLGVRLGCLG